MATGTVYTNSAEMKAPTKHDHIHTGSTIWCKTSLGDEFKGEVMAYDPESAAIVIKSASSSKSPKKSVYDISIINLSQVMQGNFKLIQLPVGEITSLPEIDRNKINRRLQLAKERIGIGVSQEAQELFNFIFKTITEVRWKDQDIIVMEEVCIAPPYTPESCTSCSTASRGQQNSSLPYLKSIVKKYQESRTLITQTVKPPPSSIVGS